MMNYYHVRTYTPFCGEEADVYIAAETEERYHAYAHQAALENGMEWFDEEEWLECQQYDKDSDDYDEVRDEYYAQCGWRLMGMITQEEYNKLNAEGEWCV
jgi:hypothetical protein